MKYFILILISLITLIIFASYGLISTTNGAPIREQKELMEEYGGRYVFDKKLREEIIQREKEREEARQKVTLGDTFWEQIEAIDSKFPKTLSNGSKYYTGLFTAYDYKKADGIKLGYEITKENTQDKEIQKLIEKNKRELGQPTAYALAIEARFSQDMEIKKDENKKPKKIDNRIQNFIKRPDDDADISKQKILVATTKEKQDKDSDLTYHLSHRTKNFVNRFKLLHHTSLESFFSQSGFSATLFYDTEKDRFVAGFRGTECRF